MLKSMYRFNRLPFRINVAPGIFQQIMDTLLNDVNNILIKSESQEQHAEHVKEVFEKVKQFGLKLSLDKCEFFSSKIKYLRQMIDAKSRKQGPSRSRAIKNMPVLTNVSTLQGFLGQANYYGNFIPDMHILRVPLKNI